MAFFPLYKRACSSFKVFAGQCAFRSGFLRWRAERSTSDLLILVFHRVMPRTEWEKTANQPMCTPVEEFVRIIEHISSEMHCLPLEEALQRLYAGGSLPARSVAISFDDGYADLASVIHPVLAKYEVPATVFLATGYVDDRNKRFWWDVVERFMYAATTKTIDTFDQATVEYDIPGVVFARMAEIVDLPVEERRGPVEEFIRKEMVYLEREEREKVCSEMAALKDMGECPMLTWGQIRVMQQAGLVQFAPHTASHPFLEEVQLEEAREEVMQSYARIREETGTVAGCFAYPGGHVPDNVPQLFSGLPVPYALTCEPGNNTAETDPLLLKRWDVGYGLVDGVFQPGYFQLRFSGML